MSASTETARFGTSAAVRRHLVEALRADLIGPFFPDDPAALEVWDLAPSKRYLYGFLVPRVKGEPDDDDDDEPELADDEAAEAGNDPGDGGQDDRDRVQAAELPRPDHGPVVSRADA